jgi:hypothetical protein
MNNIDSAIVITLGSVALKYNKPYCFPSQAHILRLLFQHHGVTISRRTLNRRLKGLELDSFFQRVRRHFKGQDGKIRFNTTLYKLKKKFFNFVGLLKAQGLRFASLFRVPFPARYQGTTHKGSAGSIVDRPPPGGEAASKGRGKPAAFGDLVRKNLDGLRSLLKSTG